ncbi:hypothetical protein K737_300526 [Holospora undulata HU1]|uniref:Uncharacterized protein n=1 Tax=Holospora undulata HU1 TaxID=1321371 RepID=A0A061JIS0_9PROT|nr:hypothetical protein K737_300526 [Holospora undulata HU1]
MLIFLLDLNQESMKEDQIRYTLLILECVVMRYCVYLPHNFCKIVFFINKVFAARPQLS